MTVRPPARRLAAGNRFVVQRHRAPGCTTTCDSKMDGTLAQLGRAQGPDTRPGGEADGRPRRGPPARLLRLRGCDPQGRVRGRRRDRVGLGHVGTGRHRRSRRRRSRPASCTSICTARSSAAASRSSAAAATPAGVAARPQARRGGGGGVGRRAVPEVGEVRARQRRGEASPATTLAPSNGRPRSTPPDADELAALDALPNSSRASSGGRTAASCGSPTSTRCCSRPSDRTRR